MGPFDDSADPDQSLRWPQQRKRPSARGKLRIFFGFAPGVGKTYRMLQVARELVSEHKYEPHEVVLGIVETHGRYDIQGLMLGLEMLPRTSVACGGRIAGEFDLDAALARKPKLLLLDDLPHTNAPEARHRKRWQDVVELLDAGIDVFSTMNVEHLESLNDVVAQITQSEVRETVPDAVLDGADSVELVDIAPEELLQRLKEGKIYLPEQAERAKEQSFRRGNLLALRELALRRIAQHVDDDVREYRQENGVLSTWPASERILVCVSAAPSSQRLIRAAARMAAGLRCPWVAAYVGSMTLASVNDADRERIESHLRLADSLGASIARLTGPSVAELLVAYARRHNVTRFVIGKPTHSRWRDLLRGSLLDAVVRGSGDIDVHVISGETMEIEDAAGHGDSSGHAPSRHYLAAAAIAIGALLLAVLLRTVSPLPDLEMLFLLAVMVSAVWFGRGPALVCAAVGIACYDFFLIPPYHTFLVHDRRYVLTFGMMFGVGFALSELAGRLRQHEREALAREERTAALYALTNELAATEMPARIASIAVKHAADAFRAQACLLVTSKSGELEALRDDTPQPSIDSAELAVARWSYEHDEPAGFGTNTLRGAKSIGAPLRVGNSRLGVLLLQPLAPEPLGVEQHAFLEVFCRQVAAALERARLREDAKLASLRAKAEEMRSSLLSAVSHDLRTPLASITGSATALRDGGNLAIDTKEELVDAIVDQAERLERLVSNLLDMTRLESGAISLRKDWVPIEEVIGSALTRLESRLERRAINVAIPSKLPLVSIDPVLFEQVFVNLLENVEKYTPPTCRVSIRAFMQGECVAIDFDDDGPGFQLGAEERIFEKFYRGVHTGISGAGLGLAICKGIIEAHGGTMTAHLAATGGAELRMIIPIGGIPPAIALEAGEPHD